MGFFVTRGNDSVPTIGIAARPPDSKLLFEGKIT
jgi:hypothetical protein